MPSAVRIKTASGWQDMALVGPTGPPGVSGAMQLIAEAILSSVGTFDFQNIPQTFRHFMLYFDCVVADTGAVSIAMRFNGDSAANYRLGRVSVVNSVLNPSTQMGQTSAIFGRSSNAAAARARGQIQIPYAVETTSHKVWLSESYSLEADAATAAFSEWYQGIWLSTAAINRIQILPIGATNLGVNSRVSLYGIAGPGQVITPPTLVTSLPASPADGQEVYYLADAANNCVWHLRYRAASSSTYKWEYLGGTPLFNPIDTDETITSTGGWLNLATDGPKVTVPLGGDYWIEAGADSYSSVVDCSLIIGVAVGDTTPFFPLAGGAGGGVNTADYIFLSGRNSGVAANSVYKVRYWMNTGGTGHFRYRRLKVTPIRVG